MVQEQVDRIHRAARTFEVTAGKVEDGINKVLEPEIKDARLSAQDTLRLMTVLSRRVTLLFGLSVAVNLVTLAVVVATR